MRALLPLACLLTLVAATPALADAPPGFQYNVLQPLGRGTEICDNIFGSLLQDSNLYYLTFQPGLQPRDVLRGDYDGTMQFNASPGIMVPFWENMPLGFLKQNFPAMAAAFDQQQMQEGRDYILRRAHFDIDASNHGQEVYQLVLPHGSDFPTLFLDDTTPKTRDALKALHASYAFSYKSDYFLMVRKPGSLEIWQLASDHAKHKGKGPDIISSHLCSFAQNEKPIASIDRKLEKQSLPLKAGQNNDVKN